MRLFGILLLTISSINGFRPRQRQPRDASTVEATTSSTTTSTASTLQNTGVETTVATEDEPTTSSTTTGSTAFNLELSATTGLEGVTLGEVSTVSTTIEPTTQSTIPTGGPTTTTTEPVFTTTTKEDTTTTTVEDLTSTTTTTADPTEITTTTERDSTDVASDTTEAEDDTVSTATENNPVSDQVTEPSTDSTNIADGEDDNGGDDEPDHPTIGWPSKNQNLQVKKIVREFEKILSGLRGNLDDDFIDRWTGENGGIGKFKNNADRIMKSITSSDRDCIDLDTMISNPFKQSYDFKNNPCGSIEQMLNGIENWGLIRLGQCDGQQRGNHISRRMKKWKKILFKKIDCSK